MVESLDQNVLKNTEVRMNFTELKRNEACQAGRRCGFGAIEEVAPK